MRSRSSLVQKMKARLAASSDNAFLRSDFQSLGGYDQVGRALGVLVSEGVLVRIGYGMYARTCVSQYDKTIFPAESLECLGREVLTKLNIPFSDPNVVRARRERRTTQVLGRQTINVSASNVRRVISFEGSVLEWERQPYEKSDYARYPPVDDFEECRG